MKKFTKMDKKGSQGVSWRILLCVWPRMKMWRARPMNLR